MAKALPPYSRSTGPVMQFSSVSAPSSPPGRTTLESSNIASESIRLIFGSPLARTATIPDSSTRPQAILRIVPKNSQRSPVELPHRNGGEIDAIQAADVDRRQ